MEVGSIFVLYNSANNPYIVYGEEEFNCKTREHESAGRFEYCPVSDRMILFSLESNDFEILL